MPELELSFIAKDLDQTLQGFDNLEKRFQDSKIACETLNNSITEQTKIFTKYKDEETKSSQKFIQELEQEKAFLDSLAESHRKAAEDAAKFEQQQQKIAEAQRNVLSAIHPLLGKTAELYTLWKSGELSAQAIGYQLIADAINITKEAISDFAAKAYEVGTAYEKIRAQIGGVFGKERVDEIYDLANALEDRFRIPLETITQRLIEIKTSGFVPFKDAVKVMTQLGDAAAATGTSYDLLFESLRRMQATGEVSVRELKNLAGVIPIFDILRDKIGLSEKDLDKLSQTAGAGREIVKIFLEELGDKYSGAMERLGQTAEGAIFSIRDTLDEMVLKIINSSDAWNAWTGVLNKVADEISNILKSQDFENFAQDIGTSIAGIGTQIKEVIPVISEGLKGTLPILGGMAKFFADIARTAIEAAPAIAKVAETAAMIRFPQLIALKEALDIATASREAEEALLKMEEDLAAAAEMEARVIEKRKQKYEELMYGRVESASKWTKSEKEIEAERALNHAIFLKSLEGLNKKVEEERKERGKAALEEQRRQRKEALDAYMEYYKNLKSYQQREIIEAVRMKRDELIEGTKAYKESKELEINLQKAYRETLIKEEKDAFEQSKKARKDALRSELEAFKENAIKQKDILKMREEAEKKYWEERHDRILRYLKYEQETEMIALKRRYEDEARKASKTKGIVENYISRMKQGIIERSTPELDEIMRKVGISRQSILSGAGEEKIKRYFEDQEIMLKRRAEDEERAFRKRQEEEYELKKKQLEEERESRHKMYESQMKLIDEMVKLREKKFEHDIKIVEEAKLAGKVVQLALQEMSERVKMEAVRMAGV